MDNNEKSNKKEIIKTILGYVLIVLFVVAIRIFVFDPVRVDGQSMNTTLHDGEIMILDKIYYKKHDIKRFDIVVIDEGEKSIIKRVIGLPNEAISYQNNKLYINGKKIDDPYPSEKTDDFSIMDIGYEKLPADCYFVMGDNRTNSDDSRFSFGAIKKEKIMGRVKFAIYPFKYFGKVE